MVCRAQSPSQRSNRTRNCGGRDPWFRSQFGQSPWGKRLGCLLIITTMKTSHPQLMATTQFDSGRWKLRLERAPVSADKQFSAPVVSHFAAGVTMLSPLVFLTVLYLWAQIVG